MGRPTSLGSESRQRLGEWGVGPPRAGRCVPGCPPARLGPLPGARRTSGCRGRGQGVSGPVVGATRSAPACAQGREGSDGQGAAPWAGATNRRNGTHRGGLRGRGPGVPAPVAGRRARCPSTGRRGSEGPRTDGRERAAAARPSRALSRRGVIAGRRCGRRRRASGRAGWRLAAQCGPGRAGPRDRPPPPLARAARSRRYPLVAALHHCYVTCRRAGRPAGPEEKLGET